MKYYSLTIFIIIFSINSLSACKCDLRSIVEELKISDEVLVGKITNKVENEYHIRIIKEWSKRPNLKDKAQITIKQQKTSCTKRLFEVNKIYLFYIENESIHNCSRTIEFSKTNDIEWLDQDRSLQNIYYNSETEYKELDYKRKHVVTDIYGNHFDTKGKNVIYIFKNKIISKNEIPEDRNEFYPIRYYIIKSDEFRNLDLLFYIESSHQDKVGEPKLSKRLINKIKKSSRNN